MSNIPQESITAVAEKIKEILISDTENSCTYIDLDGAQDCLVIDGPVNLERLAENLIIKFDIKID